MLKISVLMNSSKYPDRVFSMKNALATIDSITFAFNDSIFSADSDIVLAHESDIEPVENSFFEAAKKYKGIVIVFSGGIYGVRQISEKHFEFNYTLLLTNLKDVIEEISAGNDLTPGRYDIVLPEKIKKEIDSGISGHEKLTHDQFIKIIGILSTVKGKEILFIDDDLKQVKLKSEPVNLTLISDFSAAANAVIRKNFDLALVDFDLKSKEGNGIDIAVRIRKKNPECNIILLTGRDDFYTVLRSFSEGISHFISKSNFNLNYFRRVVETSGMAEAPFILGKSKSMLKMYELLSFYSSMSDDILITGENGTGKELVAGSLYFLGNYSGRMISINCSGIPETLFESEMFGYEGGSFTGALKNGKKSPFEEAQNGMLFLDEIGELPSAQQVKLLRVIQERSVTHLGSSRPVKFSTRLIFATNRNLKDEIRNNNFRQDFYYRISGAEIIVPPLRERREDIDILTAYFVHKFFKRNPSFDQNKLTINIPSLNDLKNYDFPGNIRELEKIVNRSLVLMLVSERQELVFMMPEIDHSDEKIEVEEIAKMLRSGVINSKGLNEEIKTLIIKYFDSAAIKVKEQAEIFGLSEQSFRNLKSKLKI